MRRGLVAFLLLLAAWPAAGDHERMTLRLRYRGEILNATFFSYVRADMTTDWDVLGFRDTARFLDGLRKENYFGRDSELTAEEIERFTKHFFEQEPLSRHDEVLVLHRGEPPGADRGTPLGLGPEILGMIAVDRLGDPFADCLPGFDEIWYERFLVEKRVRSMGLLVPRPDAVPWTGAGLPPGVFPHWEPWIAEAYFRPENIVIGDVIQANALFAHEGLWPLLHSLANAHGLFSTGRLVPNRKTKRVGGVDYVGPKVFVPTLVVWEVFNKRKHGAIRKGSRTKYYERANARPLEIGGRNEWEDPRLGPDLFFQIHSKTGSEFREGWTELFARNQNFSFVRDVEILSATMERMVGRSALGVQTLPPGHPPLGSYPWRLDTCIARMLEAAETVRDRRGSPR